MQAQRAKLPMAGLRQQLADTLATADAVVVSGETGSGKTTQVGGELLIPPR
jgi:HrpA-like RNA helicase